MRIPPPLRELFIAQVRALAMAAEAIQGQDAFATPAKAAAAHEAGHAIQAAAEGVPVSDCRIVRATVPPLGAVRLGETLGAPAWIAGPTTHPDSDLHVARRQLAGLAGELLLDLRNFRFGSSLDELALSRLQVATAAVKLGADVDRLHHRVTAEVLTILRSQTTLGTWR